MSTPDTPVNKKLASPWLIVLLCWIGAFTLSCVLTNEAAARSTGQQGLATAFFSGSRQAFGAHFAEKADVYFHLGVPQLRDLAFRDRFFQKVERKLSPDGHVHLEGDIVSETMPWYWLAIKMDPHNIQNYLVTAYWLSGSMNDFQRAHEVLMSARRNTSMHHEVELEDAMIYFKEKNIEDAERCLDAAIALWPTGGDPENRDLLLDKYHMYLFKALVCEHRNDIKNAIENFTVLLRITPDDPDLQERVENLKEGKTPSALASGLLDAMLESRGDSQGCHRGPETSDSCGSGCTHDHH